MQNLKVAVAQFEPKDGDKDYNFDVMEKLISKAKEAGAEVISFHELCITAYTFLKDLTKNEINNLAEEVPEGPSCERLVSLAKKYDIHILAGLLEKENEQFYNTYVVANRFSIVTKYRKLHPFISEFLSAGNEYITFKINDWECGILICYDNNVIENVRATTLKGAQIIFAPHVTGCTPSAMPGRGYVDDALWQNRHQDPVSLRMEFNGPKGRQWLLRWLPARAYDNGVYYAFSNPIGYDGAHLKNGNAMLLDPYGEILKEVQSFEDDITIATFTPDKLTLAGGFRYKNARRPELYSKIFTSKHNSVTQPIWLKEDKSLDS